MPDATTQALFQIIETLRFLPQLHAGMHLSETTFQPHESLLASRHVPNHRGSHAAAEQVDTAGPFIATGRDDLGRTRRCRRAHVGDEIGDREIDFVTDTGHDRNLAIEDGARDHFFVERPQVFERATAASNDQHIALGASRRHANRPGDLTRRAFTLYLNGIDQHRDRAEPRRRILSTSRTAAPVGEVTTPIRRGRRGSDFFRLASNRPFSRQLVLQLLEAATEHAFAGFLHVVGDELILTARLVEAHASARQHMHAVLGREAGAQVL